MPQISTEELRGGENVKYDLYAKYDAHGGGVLG
jgi:hypothetical protein